jgi:ATP-dependent helicase IRC3
VISGEQTDPDDSVPLPSAALPELQVPQPTAITYTDFEDPFLLVDHASGAPHIAQISPFAWVGCGKGTFVLDCLTEGFIRIDAPNDGARGVLALHPDCVVTHVLPEAYEAHYTSTHRGGDTELVFRRKRKILKADSLSSAIRGCETYVKKSVLPDARFIQYVIEPDFQIKRKANVLRILRSARWRSYPASEAQKDFIRKRHQKHLTITGKEERRDFSELTKGEAANIITRLKHGSLVRIPRSHM